MPERSILSDPTRKSQTWCPTPSTPALMTLESALNARASVDPVVGGIAGDGIGDWIEEAEHEVGFVFPQPLPRQAPRFVAVHTVCGGLY